MQKNADDLVQVNAKIPRKFRANAVAASRMLGTTVSEIIVQALEDAIAKAKQEDGEIAL